MKQREEDAFVCVCMPTISTIYALEVLTCSNLEHILETYIIMYGFACMVVECIKCKRTSLSLVT